MALNETFNNLTTTLRTTIIAPVTTNFLTTISYVDVITTASSPNGTAVLNTTFPNGIATLNATTTYAYPFLPNFLPTPTTDIYEGGNYGGDYFSFSFYGYLLFLLLVCLIFVGLRLAVKRRQELARRARGKNN